MTESDIKISEHNTKTNYNEDPLIYSINEVPPLPISIPLALQQFVTMFGGTLAMALVIKSILHIPKEDDAYVTHLIGTLLFTAGLATFIQVTFGIKLPLIQGGSLGCAPAILSIVAKNSSANEINQNNTHWKEDLSEAQGCLIVASVLQIIIGVTGMAGYLTKYVGPLTICPCITIIGISFFQVCVEKAKSSLLLTVFTSFFMIIVSQWMSRLKLPYIKRGLRVFEMFPIFISMAVSWAIAFLCTYLNLFSENPLDDSYGARTDINTDILIESKWFYMPYPFQFGFPKFSTVGILGMFVGVLASIFESLGDYTTCARICQEPLPTRKKVDRGVLVEGIGNILGAIIGSGLGNTTYSSNIAVIGITKVASLRVIQICAIIMLILGCCSRFAAVFALIPDPVVGGIFFCMFGMIASIGLACLQTVNLNSSRNLIVLGYSLIMGIGLPYYVQINPHKLYINTYIDEILKSLLVNGMFVGAIIGFILDNILPGSKRDRGFQVNDVIRDSEIYDDNV